MTVRPRRRRDAGLDRYLITDHQDGQQGHKNNASDDGGDLFSEARVRAVVVGHHNLPTAVPRVVVPRASAH